MLTPVSFDSNNPKHVEFSSQLNQLDFSPIIYKLVAHSKTNWELSKALRVCQNFRNYLWLYYTNQNTVIVPTTEVDDFWHEYLTDNIKYNQETCLLFGEILGHFGYYGMRSKEDSLHRNQSFSQTIRLYEAEFGKYDGELKASECADCLFEIRSNPELAKKVDFTRPSLV